MMRLFTAIDLPPEIGPELAEWCDEALPGLPRGAWRRVPQHLWHLTLAFYGEVKGGDVDDLCEVLDACAGECSPLLLALSGFGIFPKPARPRVFWVGVAEQDGGADLKHLARCCRRAGHATVRARTAKEQPFRGHITVARAKIHAGAVMPEALIAMPDLPEAAWRADAISLYQSILRPEGPQYRRLERFRLHKK